MSAPTDARLTRTDAAARAALLDVHEQAVQLDLAGLLDGPDYRSTATIRFACREPGAASFVDLVASTVHRVVLNGRELDPAALSDGEHLHLPDLEADNELVVEATHSRTDARCGLTRSVDASDGSVYVWTEFEPYDAHRAWACFDQPDLKTAWTFSARIPAGWTAVSNSTPSEVVDDGDCRVWTFAATPKLSAYVTALCAGPFHTVRDTHGELPIALHCRRSLADYLDADAGQWFEITRQGLDFFGSRFGMPYAGDSYDQVFLADMPGAMENYGCVTWTDSFIFRSPPSEAQLTTRAEVLLHEMAHMWFGDLVTMTWWDGLWLNESFATWAATWAAAAATSRHDAEAESLSPSKAMGFAADRAASTHPISTDVPDIATTEASFDAITYAKGAAVLRQLVSWVGEAEFLAGLRTYFTRFAWGNAELAGLLHQLEVASGRDLTEWSEQWLQAAGTNTLSVVTEDDCETYASVRIEQSAPSQHPTLRSHRLSLGVYDRAGDRLELRQRLGFDVTGRRTDVRGLVGAPVAAVLLLDDEDVTFAQRRLDPRSLSTVLAVAGGLPSSVARSVALFDVRELVLAAQLPAREHVRAVAAAATVEPVAGVLQLHLGLAIGSVTAYAPPAERRELMTALGDVCLVVLDGADPASAHARVAVAALARTATTAEQLDRLRQVLVDSAEQDLRWQALTRLVALDAVADNVVAAERQRDPDPDAGLRAFSARSARPDPQTKADVLDRVLGAEPLPSSTLNRLAESYWQPDQEELLRPYANRFLDSLPELQGRHGFMVASAVARLMFPRSGVDAAFADRVAAVAAESAGVPVLTRSLRLAEARLREQLRAQQV